jgi:NAD(P)-dependent dehydrogenase (short-subunit alcohol dehydrogenase family)
VVGLDLRPADDTFDFSEHVALDLCDADAVRSVVDGVAGRFGRIDAVVHCAAIYRREPDPTTAHCPTWSATLQANLGGLLALDRAALPWLLPGACIVHVGSVRSSTAARGAVAYTVSKAMVDQATRQLALEWAGRGIRVNAVAPGDVETPMNPLRPEDPGQSQLLARCPLGRMGQPWEIAGAILFLCSPMASYVHGATLRVDGGFLAH